MQVKFGKYEGKTVEELVLKDPGYILWCLKQQAVGPMLALQKHAKALIAKLDAKPIQKTCYGQRCSAPATRASVYGDNIGPMWWCNRCNPYQAGANNGKLQIICTFNDALQHVDQCCGGKKADQALIFKYLAQAKGMPVRNTAKAREAFFA